jgi:RNA polymerase sigma factor (sigma-70 family)
MTQSERPSQEVDDVVTYIPALQAYAMSLTRNKSNAEDLVQETLTKAIAKFHQFQVGTNLRAWLMTIMRNTFFTQTKKSSREPTGAEDCISLTLSVPATQEWALRGRELERAVMALPVHYRETLILVVMLGHDYETTAGICGVAVGTVKSRINRAREMLHKQLEPAALV